MSHKPSSLSTIRAYDVDDSTKGYRVLVDRLWPRGVSKQSLRLDQWAKSLAPSTELRKWFNHDPDKWDEFRHRYRSELSQKREDCQSLLKQADGRQILLIYAAKDEKHNNAIVLQEFLEQCNS